MLGLEREENEKTRRIKRLLNGEKSRESRSRSKMFDSD